MSLLGFINFDFDVAEDNEVSYEIGLSSADLQVQLGPADPSTAIKDTPKSLRGLQASVPVYESGDVVPISIAYHDFVPNEQTVLFYAIRNDQKSIPIFMKVRTKSLITNSILYFIILYFIFYIL